MPRRASAPRLWFRAARFSATGKRTHEASFFILDRGRQIATGTTENVEAEKALARYIRDKHSSNIARSKRETDEIPVADVINLYAQDVVPNRSRPDHAVHRLGRLLDFFDGKTLADINGKMCRDYAKSVGTDTTGRRDLEDLRAAINYHRREGLHDRIVSVAMPPARPAREKWLTRDEAARLIWELWRRGWSRHVARFVLIALYTGRRASVVGNASFARETGRTWLDTKSGYLWPPERVRKTKKRNPPIPLPARLLAHLRRWERQGARYAVQWGERSVDRCGRPVKAAGAAAGLGVVTPHVLRHTAATWQMMAGTDLFEASKYLGMTLRTLESTYAHHRPDHLTSARDAYTRNRQRNTNETREPRANEWPTDATISDGIARETPR